MKHLKIWMDIRDEESFKALANIFYMHMFCAQPVLHLGPSEHKLNWLIFYSGCTSSERLMKMRGMSNKEKTSFRRQDRKFLVNVTLAGACNWFGWQVRCEHGPRRTAVCPRCYSLEMELYFL